MLWFDVLRHDLVYGWRQLLRAPSFAVVAATAIALGVGLNVTIFSILNGLLLRPLPGVNDAGLRRVYVNHHSPLGWPDFAWIRDHTTLVQSMVGERMAAMPVDIDGAPERLTGAFATRGFFQALGVRMAAGRAFDVDDRQPGENVIVLAGAMWRSRFNSDPNVIGRTLRIADQRFTIVGVANEDFRSSVFGWAPSFWVPIASVAAVTGSSIDNFGGSLYVIARLRPGASDGAVTTELMTLAARRAAADTTRRGQFTLRLDNVRGVNAELRTPFALASGFLLAMVGLVLLIACGNVANMQLARGTARRVEMGVRLALGASRRRRGRHLLTESLVLAFVGGAAGVVAAFALVAAIAHALPALPDVSLSFNPDWTVFTYAVLLCVASTLLFGLMPALRATSPGLGTFLRDTSGGRQRARARNTLVAGQVALCVLLLGVSALLTQSFVRSRAVDPGITAAGVMDLQVDLGARRSAEDGRTTYAAIADRLRAVPGVRDVAFAELAPLSGSNMETQVAPDGMTIVDRNAAPKTYFNVVGGSYFSTLGIRMVRGRDFGVGGAASSNAVVVVNETAAGRWWPGADPIGKRLRWGGPDGAPLEVIGVARDAKYNSYGEDPTSFVYLPLSQQYRSQMIAHVRVSGGLALARSLIQAVRSADPSLAAPALEPLSGAIALALLPARLGAGLAAAFGAVALLLAASGIYGVISYMVAGRAREIGIRSALGAPRSAIVGLVVRDGLRSVVIGVGIGLGLAIAVAAVLSRALYGVAATSPAMLLGAPGTLLSIALVACWIPARRAANVDPTVAMRSE
jgi:predicted permease